MANDDLDFAVDTLHACGQSVLAVSLRAMVDGLRTALIEWSNGYVRCLACGHTTHGGQYIPHDEGCVMEGFTKQSHSGPAVRSE